MPVYSMTGYASAQHSTAPTSADSENKAAPASRLGLEIRSVNSRFLDLTLKLPDDLRQFEPVLRERITGKIKRGKVEVRVAVENSGTVGVADPSTRLLQRLNSVQDHVRAWLPLAGALSVADVLRLAANENAVSRDWSADLSELMDVALGQLMDARAREGERLTEMLRGHLAQLGALAEQAAPLLPQLVAQQRQRFLDRWQDAMGLAQGGVPPEAAQERALTEATAFAIRIDVAEELTRLRSHIAEMDQLLAKGGELGKRLDFLIQELHREANTLGSKSPALDLTRIGVDMKVLIEQMREQVQNIE